jgi:multicomponent K+:H+ antiporter subunit D
VTHWIIVPLVLSPVVAAVMMLAMRHNLGLARIFSVTSVLALLAVAIGFVWQSADGTIRAYELGNWPAPFGIVLVLDQLSALMVLLAAMLGAIVVLYAIGSEWDAKGYHFHALIQFQLMGIFGAFLTGDLFNLFVFFEILLIASYGLVIHGGGTKRLRSGVQYVVFNLLGSALFLFALGTIYAVTGTLNMADLSLRVAAMPVENAALIRVAAVLLILVFAIKAALVPLHFWLSSTYSQAPAPVAALFAVMTKVGAYAILRCFTLIFGPDVAVTQGLIDPWLLIAALVTLALGLTGVVGQPSLGRMAAFAAIGSMGTILIAISAFTPAGTIAALYYMVHSTLAGAALFLIVDLVRTGRGSVEDRLVPGPAMRSAGLIASLYLMATVGMAGLPPLSGFLGKLLVLDAARDQPLVWVIWATILVGSLLAVVGFARAGSTLFWKVESPSNGAATPTSLSLVAIGMLLGSIVAATVFAGPVTSYLVALTDQLFAPDRYIAAVLPDLFQGIAP